MCGRSKLFGKRIYFAEFPDAGPNFGNKANKNNGLKAPKGLRAGHVGLNSLQSDELYGG
jgi:hypothetical protein